MPKLLSYRHVFELKTEVSVKRRLMKEIQYHSLCLQFDDWIPEKNRENFPKKAFLHWNTETWIKIKPWVNTNRTLNNRAQSLAFQSRAGFSVNE